MTLKQIHGSLSSVIGDRFKESMPYLVCFCFHARALSLTAVLVLDKNFDPDFFIILILKYAVGELKIKFGSRIFFWILKKSGRRIRKPT